MQADVLAGMRCTNIYTPSTGRYLCGLSNGHLIVVAVQSLSRVRISMTLWTVAPQASLSFIISWSLLKLMSIESVMPSNHLILCHPLLLLPSIFASIRVFSNVLALRVWWSKYSSFSIILLDEYLNLLSSHRLGESIFKRHI